MTAWQLTAIYAVAFISWAAWLISLAYWDVQPWQVPAAIRERKARRQRMRISDLEHSLGYTPCSSPDCFSCAWGLRIPPGRETR